MEGREGEDIGIGKRMAALVARHIFGLIDDDLASMPSDLQVPAGGLEPVTIYGAEGVSVQLATAALLQVRR